MAGWPASIGIENQDAFIIERDFRRLPSGFVALMGVEPLEDRLIVIGGYPLPDGLPGGRKAGDCRLEESISSQSADKSIEDFGGFDSDRKEFRMLGGAEESESVRKPNLVFDFTS